MADMYYYRCLVLLQFLLALFPGSTPQLLSHSVETLFLHCVIRTVEWSLGTRLVSIL